jgi:hypothetical protein
MVEMPWPSCGGGESRSALTFEAAPLYDRGMDERVFDWTRGRRVRIVVANVPGGYGPLFDRVTRDAEWIDDRDRLAEDVSAIFGTHVRLEQREIDGVEEVVLSVD